MEQSAFDRLERALGETMAAYRHQTDRGGFERCLHALILRLAATLERESGGAHLLAVLEHLAASIDEEEDPTVLAPDRDVAQQRLD
jgi:hypothetical protein